jgi:hypothetical protein
MKDLLTVNNNVVIPSVYALTIPEFEKLSIKELSFVFFYADHIQLTSNKKDSNLIKTKTIIQS